MVPDLCKYDYLLKSIAFKWSKKIKSPIYTQEELYSEARVIFLECCNKYDDTKSASFKTYLIVSIENKFKTILSKSILYPSISIENEIKYLEERQDDIPLISTAFCYDSYGMYSLLEKISTLPVSAKNTLISMIKCNGLLGGRNTRFLRMDNKRNVSDFKPEYLAKELGTTAECVKRDIKKIKRVLAT